MLGQRKLPQHFIMNTQHAPKGNQMLETIIDDAGRLECHIKEMSLDELDVLDVDSLSNEMKSWGDCVVRAHAKYSSISYAAAKHFLNIWQEFWWETEGKHNVARQGINDAGLEDIWKKYYSDVSLQGTSVTAYRWYAEEVGLTRYDFGEDGMLLTDAVAIYGDAIYGTVPEVDESNGVSIPRGHQFCVMDGKIIDTYTWATPESRVAFMYIKDANAGKDDTISEQSEAVYGNAANVGLPFIWDDGGRKHYFKGETGDCVTRAFAIYLEQDYKKTYDALQMLQAQHFEKLGKKKKSVRNGVAGSVMQQYAASRGLKLVRTGEGMAGMLLSEVARVYGDGIYKNRNHVFAVKGGALRDTWNSGIYEWRDERGNVCAAECKTPWGYQK